MQRFIHNDAFTTRPRCAATLWLDDGERGLLHIGCRFVGVGLDEHQRLLSDGIACTSLPRLAANGGSVRYLVHRCDRCCHRTVDRSRRRGSRGGWGWGGGSGDGSRGRSGRRCAYIRGRSHKRLLHRRWHHRCRHGRRRQVGLTACRHRQVALCDTDSFLRCTGVPILARFASTPTPTASATAAAATAVAIFARFRRPCF